MYLVERFAKALTSDNPVSHKKRMKRKKNQLSWKGQTCLMPFNAGLFCVANLAKKLVEN